MSQETLSSVSVASILEHTNDGVFVLDEQQRFVLFNAACERLTGYTAAEVTANDRSCGDVLQCRDEHDRPVFGTLCPVRMVAEGEKLSGRQLVQITTKSGEPRWVETIFTSLRSPGQANACVIGVMRDATDTHAREQEYRQTIGELRDEIEKLHQQMRSEHGFVSIVTRSPGMRLVLDKIRSACANSSPVLISGERGTGKQRIARIIHCNGLQKSGPFVTFISAATRQDRIETELFGYARGSMHGATEDYAGLYRAADGGTLYIDGIEHLPHTVQAKLLRCIEDQEVRPLGGVAGVPVQVRVIAAAHSAPDELVVSGTLREDLFHRLGVLSIEVPALRARKEDVPLLVQQFIHGLNQTSTRQVKDVSPAGWDVLMAHNWPGNAQELRNVIESAFASGSGEILSAEEIHVPPRIIGNASLSRASGADVPALDDQLAGFERQSILDALRKAGGQRSLAARLMGISRSRLYRRMEALGIATRSNET